MKRNFKKLRVEKVDEKDGVICLVSMFPSWVMVLQWTKKVHLLQFCADLTMKPKSVKAIYIYVSESSHYTFLDNLWTIIQEGNMETWQMTPFFIFTFFRSVFNIHFWTWKCSNFIFIWSPLRSVLVSKIPQFLAKSYRSGQLITLF